MALLIANPSLDPRPIEVDIPGDGFVSTNEILPPLAVRVLRREALRPAPGLAVGPRSLENAHLKVELGDDGAIESLVHKATGREALAGRGNQLWVYPQDKPRNWDAWDVEEDYEKSGEEIVALESHRDRRDAARTMLRCASAGAGEIQGSCRRLGFPPPGGGSTFARIWIGATAARYCVR